MGALRFLWRLQLAVSRLWLSCCAVAVTLTLSLGNGFVVDDAVKRGVGSGE